MKKYLFLIVFSLFLLLGIFFYQQAHFSDGKLHVIFCDVGQGDAIFIRTPNGSDILVDGGPDDSVLSCLSGHMPFWDRAIEVVILTHPDFDHLNGLISVFKRYNVVHYATEKQEKDSSAVKNLNEILSDKKVRTKSLLAGDRIDVKDQVRFETLWPSEDGLNRNISKRSDTNEVSLIELLSYGNFKVLLTGDAPITAEDKIAGVIGKINVLKVSHHGSKTGLDSQFLDIVNPELAVISVGAKNRYGHPAPLIINLLEEAKVKTLRTDQDGEVEVISDGKNWMIKTKSNKR